MAERRVRGEDMEQRRAKERISIGVVTVSTRSSRGERPDTAGPALCRLIEEDFEVGARELVPDDRDRVSSCLVDLCGRRDLDVVITLGGTGLAPSDVTPEATGAVLERGAPGIAETIRAESLRSTSTAMLSRGTAGVRAGTLIVNFPGSERAAVECYRIIRPVLEHAVSLIRGRVTDCGGPRETEPEQRDG